MKTIAIIFTITIATSFASADSIMKPINDKGYGTISGRIQSLSMYRDYKVLGNGANSTIGIVLGYLSPEYGRFDFGLTYNGTAEIYNNNKSAILANDPINLLNEGWIRYNLGAVALTNTTIQAGRIVNNGEVFRKDDFRQKERSIEALQICTKYIKDTSITLGHAIRLSNWLLAGDRWEFNDFNDVFSEKGAALSNNTEGITWIEGVYKGIDKLEIAAFDAYAWNIVNMIGTRAKLNVTEQSALLGYYRHESNVGIATDRNSDMYGLSIQHKIGKATLETGYFEVAGNTLRFNEVTTGFNHALGSSLMVYSGQFNGGADTAYLKAVTKVGTTTLYCLYNYTWHDHDKTLFNGQELNIVVKQPIAENLTIACKGGIGHRTFKSLDTIGSTTAMDTRLFLTYAF